MKKELATSTYRSVNMFVSLHHNNPLVSLANIKVTTVITFFYLK
jgi:hypothetical protein